MKKVSTIAMVLLILLSACGGAPAVPTATINPTRAKTPTPDSHPATVTATPTEAYHIGIDAQGNLPLNTVDLMSQIGKDVPAAQLAQEQTYVLAHPEITGDNSAASSIDAQGANPWKTLHFQIDTENILSINKDKTNPDLYEIVFVQASPDGKTKAIVHLTIDLAAQQHTIDTLKNPGFTADLIFPDQVNALINGDIDTFGVDIFMNADANKSLQTDPAFATSKKIVEAYWKSLDTLDAFAYEGYAVTPTPAEYADMATKINKTQFVAPYAIKP